MIEAENETLLPVPGSRVWDALLTFDRYSRWNPFIRLRGEGAVGAKLEYIYTPTLLAKRPWTAWATILELEPMRVFTLQIRVAGLLRITERYVLQDHAGGTKLRHRLEYHGLLVRLFRGVGRRAISTLGAVDAALRGYVIKEQRARSTKALRRRSRNRPRPS